LYDILSAGGGELGPLACSPPARAVNPLPRDSAFFELHPSFARGAAAAQAGASAERFAAAAAAPAAASPAKVKVVGFSLASSSLLSRCSV
jgi:hypothetical protein